jgi:hypothetical protein
VKEGKQQETERNGVIEKRDVASERWREVDENSEVATERGKKVDEERSGEHEKGEAMGKTISEQMKSS